MDSPSSEKFSKDELALHRAEAASGKIPSLETVRKFILTIRKNWSAKPASQTKGKSRDKKAPPPSEEQIDFF